MVALTVDRLHARYALDRPAAAQWGDGCLRRVVDEELDRALARLAVPAEHLCIRRLTVRVRLHRTGAGVARSWAEQLVTALDRAIAEGDGVVVYRRTLDALVDLLVSVGRADLRRAWAWRQVGLLAAGVDPVRPDAVVPALVERPELACAALAAAAERGPVPLTAAGWVEVGRAVDGLVPPGPPTALPVPAVSRTPVARRLPAGALVGLPPADRRAVAGLLLLCAAPALAGSPSVRTAVADALAGPGGTRPFDPDPAPAGAADTRVGGAGPDRGGDRPAALAPRPRDGVLPGVSGGPAPAPVPDAGPAEAAGPDRAVLPEPQPAPRPADGLAPPPAPHAGRESPAAGVLFLIAVATALDLPGQLGAVAPRLARLPVSTVMGWLAARLGDVPADDAAVAVLAGQPPEPLDPPGPADEAAVGALATHVQVWVRATLGLDADDDLRWLWRRAARIVAEPGWVEATFELADVDTRVRAAGLDLDPGFVWWLGAVVRYRYV